MWISEFWLDSAVFFRKVAVAVIVAVVIKNKAPNGIGVMLHDRYISVLEQEYCYCYYHCY